MIPTLPTDAYQTAPADVARPQFFLDDSFDATTDNDWLLDQGAVTVPVAV